MQLKMRNNLTFLAVVLWTDFRLKSIKCIDLCKSTNICIVWGTGWASCGSIVSGCSTNFSFRSRDVLSNLSSVNVIFLNRPNLFCLHLETMLDFNWIIKYGSCLHASRSEIRALMTSQLRATYFWTLYWQHVIWNHYQPYRSCWQVT